MANDQGLEMHLRRRFVEQATPQHVRRRFIERAAAQRPRLPGNLKQLGAVGPVTRPLAASSRTAFVKVGVTQGQTTGKHLAYLTRAQHPGTQPATLFGPGVVDTAAFVQAARQDPHQFRIVVQVPEHPALDRTHYIELCLAQVERDFQRPLAWVAAHHFDTPYPHTHIVLRGRDRDGKDLYVERHYLTHGLRTRAAEVLTWLLGPVRQQQQFTQSNRLTYDGALRGLDDPDSRARVQQTSQMPRPQDFPTADGTLPLRERLQVWSENRTDSALYRLTIPPDQGRQADILAAARQALQSGAAYRRETPGQATPPDTGASLARLTAQLTALRQILQAQQQAQQRGQGMGF
jgi:hypothetical protein